jgi:hypothetical protein
MKVQLTPSYILTTEHSASSYGQPVLVERDYDTAYGPADIFEPYSSWGLKSAALHVARVYKWRKQQLTPDECNFVECFIKGFPTV